MDCLGLASIQATQSGLIEVNGEKIPALRGDRLSDGQPLTIYPGEVPARVCRARPSGSSRDFSLKTFVRRSWMSIGLYRTFASTRRWNF